MENSDSTSRQLIGYGIKFILVAGAVYGINKLLKNYQKSSTEQQVEDKPEVRQAMAIFSSMNPSGMDWMKKMDGTNTELIFSTAKEISDMNKVQAAYKKLYDASMLDDLRQELSPEDYAKFLNTLKFSPKNINKGANKPKIDFKRGTYIATKLQVNLRKTPKNISRWSFSSNIIKLAEAGKFLGFTTGKSEFDNSGEGETGTLFIQIQTVAKDTRKAIFFWAAASQVQTVSQAEFKAHKYPVFYLNEEDTLDGFNENQKRVIAVYSTPVMNENFKTIGIASPLQELGYLLMILRDNKGNEYIKFISPQKKQYWVTSSACFITTY